MGNAYMIYFILHGGIILLLGNVIGFPLARALASRHISETKTEAWRMAHSANTGFGVFLIATGAAFQHLTLTAMVSSILLISLVASGYGFLVGTIIAGVTGHKGLKFKGPLWNWVALGCYHVGVLGSMVGVPLLVYGALRSL
jgi:hypothetical protein